MSRPQFWRSTEKTESSFLSLVSIVAKQNFNTGDEAKTWLNSNGYWTNWEILTPTYNVGDILYGGIVFQTWSGGTHGLISQSADTSTSISWGCQGTAIGTTNYFDGNANTTAILSGCATRPIASSICRAIGSEWYLPSYDEMATMTAQSVTINLSQHTYWTSSEGPSSNQFVAWTLYPPAGVPSGYTEMAKNNNNYVRAIRQF